MRASLTWTAAGGLLLCLCWPGVVRADVVELKTGQRLSGEIIQQDAGSVHLKTRFGTQKISRADIVRIEKGDTPQVALKKLAKALAKDDAEGHYQASLEARKLGMRKLSEQLMEGAARIDPLHEAANTALGKVRYKGGFVTPEERDRLEKEARAAEMRAQGLVEHDGRYVTPEEKVKLAQGLVLRNGEWVDQDEAKRLDGFVKVDGAWVRVEDHAIDEFRAEIEELIGKRLTLVKTSHIAVYTDIEGDFAGKVAELLQKGHKRFAQEFKTGQGLDWMGERRIDVVVFKLRFDYQKFIDFLGSIHGMGSHWSQRARRVTSIYRVRPHGLASTYMANKGQKFTAAHCANMLGHVLIHSYREEGQNIPPFFDEAFAALTEFDLLGRNVVYSLGSGKYAKTMRDDEHQFFEDGLWAESLRKAMRTLGDTPLDQAVRRDHADLLQMDVAKGMALYQRWRGMGDDKLKVFFDRLKETWPKGDPPVTHPLVLQAVVHSFHAVEGKDIPVVDQELRKYAMQKMK